MCHVCVGLTHAEAVRHREAESPSLPFSLTHAHSLSHLLTNAHARIHARMHARTHARTHTRTRARTHTHMHTHTHCGRVALPHSQNHLLTVVVEDSQVTFFKDRTQIGPHPLKQELTDCKTTTGLLVRAGEKRKS